MSQRVLVSRDSYLISVYHANVQMLIAILDLIIHTIRRDDNQNSDDTCERITPLEAPELTIAIVL